ncbi:HmuY family protein [Mesonia aquimarina]|uniref:HmuY family protein n=1 Tax=Mesonia aquimarina TaxID=1504967 RepID=UPI000EF57A55|nr:HmuY family protein [Mesonia aquimarina]
MKKQLKNLSIFIFLSLVLISCTEDDSVSREDFIVAFENPSENFSAEVNEINITIVFASAAPENGKITVTYNLNNVEENQFSTNPTITEGTIVVPFSANSEQTSFSITKENANISAEDPFIEFSISEVSLENSFPQGNISTKVNFAEAASLGGSISPEIGGPNEGNQVYVDLSGKTTTEVFREKWDLGFFSGEEFRVKLNASLFMMAASLGNVEFDEVNETNVESLQGQMAFLVPGSDEYVDAPSGNINETAIDEISITEDENNVYLLKLGNKVGTETPEIGSIAVAGEARGWKKIQILRDNNEYVLRYADLNSNSYQEITIPKTPSHNFTFFSFNTENIVTVEPQKQNWDLNFTVFTEVLDLPEGGFGAYGFSDYVSTNTLANVEAYQVNTSEISYQDFSTSTILEEKFELDQRVIGANWRDVFSGMYTDRFYIIKDTEGNFYKLRFTAFLNENGVRGYPSFEYELLN